jgi:hypothetical protein
MTQQCRQCGCSNFSSCERVCWWVDDDLCSNCGVAVDVATGRPVTDEELPSSGDLIREGIDQLLARLPEGVIPETFDDPPVDDPDPDLAYLPNGEVLGRVIGWVGDTPVIEAQS